MINLRYHIVSLTAVFLAIGIGLTLGSTFLDRATVENLNGQLENLETRLGDRDERIETLEQDLGEAEALQTALDEQGPGLLAGRLEGVPVVVLAAVGVDEADVAGAVQSLETAGADLQGQWWLTERLLLADQADIDDLAAVLEEDSGDPARLRRLVIDGIGREVRVLQRQDAAVDFATPEGLGPEDPATGELGEEDTEVDELGGDDVEPEPTVPLVGSLADAGFVVFEPASDGPEELTLPPGVRVVVVGGSSVLPDDVFVQPLIDRLTQSVAAPTRTVVTSASGDGPAVSEVVAAIRSDEELRSLVATVDRLDHFQGWMATVLAVEDLADGTVGHYGLGEGASALLPPLRDP